MPESQSNLFFELFMPCQRQIRQYLFMLVHDESDADDLLQETAKTMWQQFASYDPCKSFFAWGLVIALNKAFSFLRTKSKTRRTVSLSENTCMLIAEMNVREKDDLEQKKSLLKKCIEKLGAVDLKILNLRYQEGVPANQIAERLGRSSNGIYHTMARIHNVLNRCVKKHLAME